MFSNERYITNGISNTVPEELQVYLWQSIDIQKSLYGDTVDYLQVFTFKRIADDTFAITQSQEQPERTTTHYIAYKENYSSIESKKIFVIDDGAYSTMLFAEEY